MTGKPDQPESSANSSDEGTSDREGTQQPQHSDEAPRISPFEVPSPSGDSLEGSGKSGAVRELLAFNQDSESWMRRWKWSEALVIASQALLFIFALLINWWWAKNVLALLWQSGREGTRFHLSDKVLIALVTTSVANFLALVLIIARSLFPDRKER